MEEKQEYCESADLNADLRDRRGVLGLWWGQGARTAFFMTPCWNQLRCTPAVLACLVLVPYLMGLLYERLYIEGPASFYWPSVQSDWAAPIGTLWICWLLIRSGRGDTQRRPAQAVDLFAMMAAQNLTIGLVSALIFVPMYRGGMFSDAALGHKGWWTAWGISLGWIALAPLTLIWRTHGPGWRVKLLAVALLLSMIAIERWWLVQRHWFPLNPPEAEARVEPFRLTQEIVEAQTGLLAAQTRALRSSTPGKIDFYALTFAPYAEEDVFRRESALVAGVMQDRFGTKGTTLQLVNHAQTAHQLAWATPINLKRAIEAIAQLMHRDEDILFIHLTSHGARDGQLSASFWPLTIETVTPQMLRRWLDDAGIRYRLLSISACYSGSWIEPLANADTLVMTAADAEHTSYGCGRLSELTFFGRAMYDEALRRTWSFEQAHADAKRVIELREIEAGKDDGFSNPQIRVGAGIRPHLERLKTELGAEEPLPEPKRGNQPLSK